MNRTSANSECCTQEPSAKNSASRRGQESACQMPARLYIGEGKAGYVIEVDVPGVSRESLEITINEGVLEVTGSRTEPERPEFRAVFSDRQFGSFRRAVRLPEDVDPEQVDASLAEGVLKIELHRVPETQPRRVEIKIPTA